MKIPIKDIVVDYRIRIDPGDIDTLARSIQEFGQLSPIIVDKNYKLICGFRRLEACKKLGFKDIEANVMDIQDPKLQLEIETQENLMRKNFTPKEIERIALRKKELSKSVFWTNFLSVIKNFFKSIANFFKKLFHKKKQENDENMGHFL